MGDTPHRFLEDEDLSETQIYITNETYDRSAPEYAEKWEWNPVTVREIQKYNITPFLKFARPGGTVLLVECQSGRDYTILEENGFSCFGVGSSYGLLTEAIKRVPKGFFARLEPRRLPLMPESVDSIYADALTSVPRRDLPSTLTDFRLFLRPGGTLYLSLKIAEKNVLEISDLGGSRYFVLYRTHEIVDMLKKSGFILRWSAESLHTDPTLPKWFSVIAQKSA
ncbi:MAG: hypothetical protein Q7S76_02335 [bacterium]|nr:hypothetical protein [bacterium]